MFLKGLPGHSLSECSLFTMVTGAVFAVFCIAEGNKLRSAAVCVISYTLYFLEKVLLLYNPIGNI